MEYCKLITKLEEAELLDPESGECDHIKDKMDDMCISNTEGYQVHLQMEYA